MKRVATAAFSSWVYLPWQGSPADFLPRLTNLSLCSVLINTMMFLVVDIAEPYIRFSLPHYQILGSGLKPSGLWWTNTLRDTEVTQFSFKPVFFLSLSSWKVLSLIESKMVALKWWYSKATQGFWHRVTWILLLALLVQTRLLPKTMNFMTTDKM